ncbi:MAG: prepilin peptidase [Patescibacteria group bacterium]|jgi:leader peptidase (prepilin peptidase)/N-methyltransferase
MIVIFFILGLIIGSFLNCLIWRVYKGESMWGFSHCLSCQKTIKWYDNIPVLSFFILRGKCRFCQAKIPWYYPVVELVTGLLFAGSFYYHAYVLDFNLFYLIFFLLVISFLIIFFVFDLRWFLVPVNLLIGGAVLIFFFQLYFNVSVLNILISVFLGAAFFALQFFISRGKWIGEGDIWLGGFWGLVFAKPFLVLFFILLTYIIGGLVSIILIVSGYKKLGEKIPLGVFMSLAALIVLFFGEPLLSWYLGLFLF